MQKKYITSLPSTMYQDGNVASLASIARQINIYTDPKTQLTKIIKHMKTALNYRVYLHFHDIQQIYNNSSEFISDFLHYSSAKQLWVALDRDGDDALLEKQQLIFLTKFITELTKRKQKYGDTKKYIEFTETKALIQWLEERTVQYQKFLRNKIKQKMVRKMNRIKIQRQSSFQFQQRQYQAEMENQKKNAYNALTSRQNLERSHLQEDLVEKVKNSMHKIRPSIGLSKTKDIALLAKLAPYRHDKKREYQCKQLDKSLIKTMQHDMLRQQKAISHLQNMQRKRLTDKQNFHQSVFDQKIKQKQVKMRMNVRQKKLELEKSEKIKMHKTIEQANKIANERINWIRNSLRAYSQRQQQKKIKEILRDHRNRTQFINNSQDIVYQSQKYEAQYTTINMECTDIDKQRRKKRYSGFDYQSKLMRKIKREHDLLENQEIQDMQGQYSISKRRSLDAGRKSLVDLYDDKLQLVQKKQ